MKELEESQRRPAEAVGGEGGDGELGEVYRGRLEKKEAAEMIEAENRWKEPTGPTC